MKKAVFILFSLFLVGCTNNLEEEKNEYLTYKNTLKDEEEFTSYEQLPCNITFSIDKISEEEISYRAIIDKPKENMYDIKAIVIHDYFTEDIFPSIGIFDDTYDLIVGDENVKGISLVGYIETNKNYEDLNLELRVLLEYKNENDEVKKIYYKTT